MTCTKHGVHQELGENCPECTSEEIRAEEALDTLTGQEQASGTDVLSNDCLGCPLYVAKEHKGDTVPVSKVDRLFLRYLLWKEVYHSGYTEQMGQILSRLFPDDDIVPRD